MERIGISDRPGNSSRIKLYAARGEYEPFQIGIQAHGSSLNNVNIAVSDLKSANNKIIANNNITLYKEHYVYVTNPSPDRQGSNKSLGKGWYADGLIPFGDNLTGKYLTTDNFAAVPFSLEAGKNQPIWVDVYVPRDTVPGEYRGTFTVTSDRGTNRGEINLQVWDFELPLKPSLSSAFLFWGEQTQQASQEILKHKLNPQFNSRPLPELERELIDRWGLKSVNLGFWSGAELGNCRMSPPPSVAEIKAEAARHQPDLFKYVYSADEIGNCKNLYEPMKQWGRAIHQAGYANLVVMPPVPELYDDALGKGRSAVDVWVVLPIDYEKSAQRIQQVLRKGDQVWSYNALVQDGYSPKWQIDFAPINFRIQPGFISQSLGLTGLLYWRMDLWTSNPWHDVRTFFDKFDNNRPYPGDGMLVYPGEQVGVKGIVPSMRLKWLREGVEDYEYVEIMKRLGQEKSALLLSKSVGRDWRNWTQKPQVILSVRNRLAKGIERIKTTTKN
ncbi:DUF4091 domain-containing protein [Calothrix sp. UHCC 0171]|uniref:DUF4091 domain-containing protein n=1 Tax=Calothrix sp. UHCC 0171 TaxID=3110245 RepID=UPI002B1F6BD9|nr:glycoside hydrolase domain-containing protein [Calothrix sp. UHCC 0171]MEA5571817.1 glycoside hydrolase domain-containing protein [Calothrix sp. UHCC 0171]